MPSYHTIVMLPLHYVVFFIVGSSAGRRLDPLGIPMVDVQLPGCGHYPSQHDADVGRIRGVA